MRNTKTTKLAARRAFERLGLEVDDEDERRMPRGLVREGVWIEAGWNSNEGLRFRLIRELGAQLRGPWYPSVHDAMRESLFVVGSDER